MIRKITLTLITCFCFLLSSCTTASNQDKYGNKTETTYFMKIPVKETQTNKGSLKENDERRTRNTPQPLPGKKKGWFDWF